MNQQLKEKIQESFASVMPVTIIVLLLSVILVPMEIGTIAMFLVGALLLVVGMGIFSLGADIAMMPMGEGIGVQFAKTKNILIVIGLGLLMGIVITIAEPDLQVLAKQVPSIPDMTLILTVAVGVGIFLVLAILRILFKISLSKMLMVTYVGLFVVSFFAPTDFIAVAFDSGGVTTGPITVPFIMAMGLGLASVRSDKDAADDSFGLVALCSAGPILAVLLLGIFYNPSDATYSANQIPHIETTVDLVREFTRSIPHYAYEVFIALAAVVIVFIAFQFITKRFRQSQLIRMSVGFLYTFVGLVLFLTGVNVGFMPVGQLLGSQLASGSHPWLLIPIGMLVAYFIVAAEPAVHVLNKQVEEVSNGAIPRSVMLQALSIGVAISVALSMIRVLTGISIYWLLIPGYAIALIMTRFVPKLFVGIAFDSGGVASGPMTTTFLLPLAMGACEALGGNVMTDAFGVVAMVAMTPLLAIQIMGIVFTAKAKRADEANPELGSDDFDEFTNLDEEVAPSE